MNIYNISIVLSLIFILIILYLIKKRKIEFNYSLFWFSISIIIFVLAINRNLLERISNFFGIDYAPALLFIGGILFNIVINFYITIKISDMKKRMTRLTQEVGILKSKLDHEEQK